MKRVMYILLSLFLIVFPAVIGGCNSDMKQNKIDGSRTAKRNIDSVMVDHTDELMALPGVVGLFVDKSEGKIPCIRVMVVKKNAELEKKIPLKIEGHPVVIEETGEIKPL
jgi:hypothetical protein